MQNQEPVLMITSSTLHVCRALENDSQSAIAVHDSPTATSVSKTVCGCIAS